MTQILLFWNDCWMIHLTFVLEVFCRGTKKVRLGLLLGLCLLTSARRSFHPLRVIFLLAFVWASSRANGGASRRPRGVSEGWNPRWRGWCMYVANYVVQNSTTNETNETWTRREQRMEGCHEPRPFQSTTFQTVVALPVDVVIPGWAPIEQLDMPLRQFAAEFAPFRRSDTYCLIRSYALGWSQFRLIKSFEQKKTGSI